MNKSVEALLESFERLPDEAKREAASEIIRRSVKFSLPPLEDQALVEAAAKFSWNWTSTSLSMAEPRRGEEK